jgi:hypothetical protein
MCGARSGPRRRRAGSAPAVTESGRPFPRRNECHAASLAGRRGPSFSEVGGGHHCRTASRHSLLWKMPQVGLLLAVVSRRRNTSA